MADIVGARADIYRRLDALARGGKTIIKLTFANTDGGAIMFIVGYWPKRCVILTAIIARKAGAQPMAKTGRFLTHVARIEP